MLPAVTLLAACPQSTTVTCCLQLTTTYSHFVACLPSKSQAACSHLDACLPPSRLQSPCRLPAPQSTTVTCCLQLTTTYTHLVACLPSKAPAASRHLLPACPPVDRSHMRHVFTCWPQSLCCPPAPQSTTVTCCPQSPAAFLLSSRLESPAGCSHLLPTVTLLPTCPPVDYSHLAPAACRHLLPACPPVEYIHLLLESLCCLPAPQSTTVTCYLQSPDACLPSGRLQSPAACSHLAACLPPSRLQSTATCSHLLTACPQVDYSHLLPAVPCCIACPPVDYSHLLPAVTCWPQSPAACSHMLSTVTCSSVGSTTVTHWGEHKAQGSSAAATSGAYSRGGGAERP
jgi:hypothetical protein